MIGGGPSTTATAMELQTPPDGPMKGNVDVAALLIKMIAGGVPPEEAGRAIRAMGFDGVPAAPIVEPPSKTGNEAWAIFKVTRGPALSDWSNMETRGARVLSTPITVGDWTGTLGDLPMNRWTIHHLEAYRAVRRTQISDRTGEEPAAASRNREVSVLGSLCTWAVRFEHLARSPIRGAPAEPENNTRDVVVSDEQVLRFAQDSANDGDRCTSALTLLLHGSGLRLKEAQMLRLHDIDEDQQTIAVRPSTAKRKKGRTASISVLAIAAIKAMPTWPGRVFVFENSKTGRPLNRRGLQKKFDHQAAKWGFVGPEGEKVWRHDLRRTDTTELIRNGTDRATVKLGTGHSTDAAFSRYNMQRTGDLVAARRVRDGQMLNALAEMIRKDPKASSNYLQVLLGAVKKHG